MYIPIYPEAKQQVLLPVLDTHYLPRDLDLQANESTAIKTIHSPLPTYEE